MRERKKDEERERWQRREKERWRERCLSKLFPSPSPPFSCLFACWMQEVVLAQRNTLFVSLSRGANTIHEYRQTDWQTPEGLTIPRAHQARPAYISSYRIPLTLLPQWLLLRWPHKNIQTKPLLKQLHGWRKHREYSTKPMQEGKLKTLPYCFKLSDHTGVPKKSTWTQG